MSESDGEDGGRQKDPGGWDEKTERLLVWSLRLIYIPVVVLLLAGLGAFVFGTVFFVHGVRLIVDHPFPVGHHIGLFLLDIDLFLIGATLLIAALGFYELFIREIHFEGSSRIPGWLAMSDLNDLKARVIGMIILVVSVSFVEVVVDAPSGQQVLDLGGGIAAVIVALTVFLRLGGRGTRPT